MEDGAIETVDGNGKSMDLESARIYSKKTNKLRFVNNRHCLIPWQSSYICARGYPCTYTYVCMYIYIYMYVCMYVCIYIYIKMPSAWLILS